VKVILQQDVKNLGNKGDLVEVSQGYARNFLFPRGLAVEANASAMKSLEHERAVAKQRAQRELSEARERAERLQALAIRIPAKAGESGRLFGSVTASDIAEAVKSASGIEIDRRRIDLKEPIKALGNYRVAVQLHSQVVAQLNVQVVEGDRA